VVEEKLLVVVLLRKQLNQVRFQLVLGLGVEPRGATGLQGLRE
jgi:hypothetical protein